MVKDKELHSGNSVPRWFVLWINVTGMCVGKRSASSCCIHGCSSCRNQFCLKQICESPTVKFALKSTKGICKERGSGKTP